MFCETQMFVQTEQTRIMKHINNIVDSSVKYRKIF